MPRLVFADHARDTEGAHEGLTLHLRGLQSDHFDACDRQKNQPVDRASGVHSTNWQGDQRHAADGALARLVGFHPRMHRILVRPDGCPRFGGARRHNSTASLKNGRGEPASGRRYEHKSEMGNLHGSGGSGNGGDLHAVKSAWLGKARRGGIRETGGGAVARDGSDVHPTPSREGRGVLHRVGCAGS